VVLIVVKYKWQTTMDITYRLTVQIKCNINNENLKKKNEKWSWKKCQTYGIGYVSLS